MNATERIQAAIDKLEGVDYFAYAGWLCETQDGEPVPLSSDENHVLVYGTIPAQLAMLRSALDCIEFWHRKHENPGECAEDDPAIQGELALADAILGES